MQKMLSPSKSMNISNQSEFNYRDLGTTESIIQQSPNGINNYDWLIVKYRD
jgi:hypothetical protein